MQDAWDPYNNWEGWGMYQIINEDCVTALKKLGDECVDLIFSDPPYWMRTRGVLKRVEGTEYDGCQDAWDNAFQTLGDYEDFTKKWLAECKRVLKKDGSLWVIGGLQCIYTIGAAMQELGFWIINDVVWQKSNPTPNFMGTRLNNSHETLIWAVKSPRARYTFNYKTAKALNRDGVSSEDFEKGVRKQLGSVWKFPVCSGKERLKDDAGNKLHSTQKPFELLYRVINISSKVGDVVLDPFGGTFTTGAAALQCGRSFIGIEASKKYCEYGERRLGAVKEKLGDIERAKFDEKGVKVDFVTLIDNKHLISGEQFFLKGVEEARLESSGKVFLPKFNITADIHSGAALVLGGKAKRVNGFDVWQVRRGGKLVLLREIRDEYRRELEAEKKNESKE